MCTFEEGKKYYFIAFGAGNILPFLYKEGNVLNNNLVFESVGAGALHRQTVSLISEGETVFPPLTITDGATNISRVLVTDLVEAYLDRTTQYVKGLKEHPSYESMRRFLSKGYDPSNIQQDTDYPAQGNPLAVIVGIWMALERNLYGLVHTCEAIENSGMKFVIGRSANWTACSIVDNKKYESCMRDFNHMFIGGKHDIDQVIMEDTSLIRGLYGNRPILEQIERFFFV